MENWKEKERSLNEVTKPDSPDQNDNTAGYGNPPLERRFKPGESGNRRGRPRGSQNRKTILKKIAHETITLKESGKKYSRTTLEWMLIALRNLAIGGNLQAFRAYQKLLEKYEPQESQSKLGYLVVPAGMTPEEAIAEGEKANEEARAKRAENTQNDR